MIEKQDSLVVLGAKTVREITNLSTSSVKRKVREGSFPQPVKVSERRCGWIEGEVYAWLRQRIAERDAKVAA